MKRYDKYKDSKVAWLGQVPEHWGDVRLASCFSERKDTNKDNEFNRAFQFKYGNIVYKKDAPIDAETIATFKKYAKVCKDDIIVNGLNLNYDFLTQRVAIVPQKGIITSAYIAMIPRKIIVPKFACYLLKAIDEKKLLNGMGTGIRLTLSFGELKKQYIPYTSGAEQEQIVRYLDWKVAMADKFVREKKQEIALLRELRQAEINQAVTRGLDPNAPTRPSGIDWIGEIPQRWKITRLKDVFVSNERSLSGNTPPDEIISYLDISSVGFGCIKEEPKQYLFKDAPSRARRIIKAGDIIISTVRTYLKSLCYITNDIEKCIVSTGFAVLSPKHNDDSLFLSYALSTNYFVDNVIKCSIGISYPAISDSKLMSQHIIIPETIPEQQQIVAHIQTVEERINKAIEDIEKQIALVAEYKASLISDVTTGKVDVRGIEIPDYEKEEPIAIEEDNEETDN